MTIFATILSLSLLFASVIGLVYFTTRLHLSRMQVAFLMGCRYGKDASDANWWHIMQNVAETDTQRRACMDAEVRSLGWIMEDRKEAEAMGLRMPQSLVNRDYEKPQYDRSAN